jgi:hypothetical protein
LGGDNNNKQNLAILTAREHFICHRLLVRMLEGTNRARMVLALKIITRMRGQVVITSRIFQTVREESAKAHRLFQTGRTLSEDTKEKLRIINTGKKYGKRNPTVGAKISAKLKGRVKSETHLLKLLPNLDWTGKSHSEETKQRMRKPKSESHKANMSIARSGIRLSDDHKKALSDAKKCAPKFICPHCYTKATAAMFGRWHGDKCRVKEPLTK